MKLRTIILSTILLIFLPSKSKAQTLLQGWYWDYPKTTSGASWTDTIDGKLDKFQAAGFTHIWLPPASRASFGSVSNGYDPKDLYDLGSYGLGPTGLGSRQDLDSLISHINARQMTAVADVVYNHRDGGKAEINTSVEGWIENYTCYKKNVLGDRPYPSDRFRCILPLGGTTNNGAGTYYFKIRSKTRDTEFNARPYKFYVNTSVVGFQNLPPLSENESSGNGGGDCGQGNVIAPLGVDINATIDNSPSCDNGCGIDEFAVTINAGQFNSSGDTLFIYLSNVNGNYSDHYVHGLWSGARSMDIQSEIKYQTYTDFMNMPSGRATMNHTNFKPNGSPTTLGGDLDSPLFFYDYDQNVSDTRQELIDWTQWLNDSIGFNGLRMDAVKHFPTTFVSALLDSLYNTNQTPNMIVGEFFDFNPNALKTWVDNVENGMTPAARTASEVRIFDFALRGALESACDQFGYDVRNVFTSGIVNGAGGNKNQAVTFVNNHDFRTGTEHVDNDPELPYAYILTNPNVGVPSVFYPDLYGTNLPAGPDANLNAEINQLMFIKKNFTDNAQSVDYISRIGSPYSVNYLSGFPNTTLAYYVHKGGQDTSKSLVVINFAGENLSAEIPLGNNYNQGANQYFREKTGKSFTPIVVTDNLNRLKIALPPRSYGVWVLNDAVLNCGRDSIIYVDKNSTGDNDGGSWSSAYVNLPSALMIAETCNEVIEVRVKQGTYLPNFFGDRNEGFMVTTPIRIKGGYPQSLANPNDSNRDPVLFPTILSGEINASGASDNVYHVFTNLTPTAGQASLLDGFIIENGTANGAGDNSNGGGIFNYGKLIIQNCDIKSSCTATNGTAIYNNNAAILNVVSVIANTLTGSTAVFNAPDAVIEINNLNIKED